MFLRDLHNLQNSMDRMFDSMMNRYDQMGMGSMMGDMGSVGFDDDELDQLLMDDQSMGDQSMTRSHDPSDNRAMMPINQQTRPKYHRSFVRRGESEKMHDRAGMHMMPATIGGMMTSMGKGSMMSMKMSPIDLKEYPNEYILTCELAGCDRKSIDIAADKDKHIVTIRAEKREEHHEGNMPTVSTTGTTPTTTGAEDNTTASAGQVGGQAAAGTLQTQGDRSVSLPMGHRYLRQERSYGMVERSLRIPDDCDFDRSDAQFENGVLKVRIPRIANAAQDTRFTQKIRLS